MLPRDPPQDPVHEPARLVGGISLRQRDRLVDRHLDRHLAAVELEDPDPQDVSLQRAEPVRRPPLGGGREPCVQLVSLRRDSLGVPLSTAALTTAPLLRLRRA